MTISYSHPKMSDLATIMEIERASFSTEEAATEAAMKERILLINDTFIVARDEQNKVVGYIVGPAFGQRYLTDDLYHKLKSNTPELQYQTVLSLAVSPSYRHLGIGSHLLTHLAKIAIKQNRKGITLTCLAELVSFYEKNGYQNEGVSTSAHAGELWYNMVLAF